MALRSAKRLSVRGAKGHRLACRVLGATSSPVAILTSGIGCGPVFMHQIARELAQDHHVVYWDYRGHGSSDLAPPESGYRVQDHAEDLDHIVRAFSPNRPPVMIGFSMGVQVAVEWTRSNPGQASSHVFMLGVPRNPVYRTIVLRAPVARLAEGLGVHARLLLSLLQPATRAALRTPLTYAFARSLGIVEQGCPMSEFLDFVRYATDVPLDAYLRCCAGLLEHDATDAFMRIREPVLMMAGEHDVFINAKECRSFAARLSDGRFELLRCASHAGSIEYGRYAAGRIRRFLQVCQPGVSNAA